jgi:capsular exopolysaccharide synthesis family protein
MKNAPHSGEINLEKLYNIIIKHKSFILILTLLSLLITSIFLYFQASTYRSTAILEIRSQNQKPTPSDVLLSSFSLGASKQIDKELETLKTFWINNEALKKIDLRIGIFKKHNYKKIELYDEAPISVHGLKILDNSILGQEFILEPYNGQFKLKSLTSWSNLFGLSNTIELDEGIEYPYGERISTPYFEFTIKKKKHFNEPIYLVIYGENRKIYDTTISKNLTIAQVNPKAPLLEIQYEDTIPQRANDYVNSLAECFIENSKNQKSEQNRKIISFIDEQLFNIKEVLKSSENKLEDYKVSNKIVEPSLEANSYIQKLAKLEIQLTDNRLKEKLASNLVKLTKNSKNLDSIAPALMELKDQPTLQLITTLQTLQLQKEELQIRFTNQHPEVLATEKKIYSTRRKILLNIKNLEQNFKQQERSLLSEKEAYEKKIKNLPTKEKRLVNIKRDYEVSSSMYDYLLQKRTENEILMVATLSDYKILDYAHTITDPIKPKRGLLLLASIFIGLLLGTILAIMREGLKKTIDSKDELQELSHLALYGVIPKINYPKHILHVFENRNSHFTESLRSLRANIQHSKKSNESSIILLTSTTSGEGKSTISANLASVFQMANYKTLLISLDLRQPTLHHYFNLPNIKGMSGFLNGTDSVHDIIFKTQYKNLHLIPPGTIPANPSELILSEKLPKLLEVLRTRYDYILIDSAPIGLVSDTLHLMKYADINLFVLRESYSHKSFLNDLDNLIEKNNLHNIRLVLNASNTKRNKSYGYGYGYGHQQ